MKLSTNVSLHQDVVSNAFFQVKEDHQVRIEQMQEEHREHIK